MDIVLPRDVRDLKIQIGIDILKTGMRQIGASSQIIDTELLRARDVDHIDAAEKWREEYEEVFRQLGVIADRAILELPSTDNALMSLLSDFHNNYPWVGEALSGQSIEYVSRLIFGVASHLQSIEQILESLSSFGRGE